MTRLRRAALLGCVTLLAASVARAQVEPPPATSPPPAAPARPPRHAAARRPRRHPPRQRPPWSRCLRRWRPKRRPRRRWCSANGPSRCRCARPKPFYDTWWFLGTVTIVVASVVLILLVNSASNDNGPPRHHLREHACVLSASLAAVFAAGLMLGAGCSEPESFIVLSLRTTNPTPIDNVAQIQVQVAGSRSRTLVYDGARNVDQPDRREDAVGRLLARRDGQRHVHGRSAQQPGLLDRQRQGDPGDQEGEHRRGDGLAGGGSELQPSPTAARPRFRPEARCPAATR